MTRQSWCLSLCRSSWTMKQNIVNSSYYYWELSKYRNLEAFCMSPFNSYALLLNWNLVAVYSFVFSWKQQHFSSAAWMALVGPFTECHPSDFLHLQKSSSLDAYTWVESGFKMNTFHLIRPTQLVSSLRFCNLVHDDIWNRQLLWRLSTLQLQTNLACRHLESFVRMRSKTTQIYWKVTTSSNHSPTQIRKVAKQESRVQTQRSNAAETRVTNQCITTLVNEQETIPDHTPNTLVPRSIQSAVSPSQILVVFSNFNYPQFIPVQRSSPEGSLVHVRRCLSLRIPTTTPYWQRVSQ